MRFYPLLAASICVTLCATVTQAQLKVGDGGLVGYHSDFRKQPVYYTAAATGSYQGQVLSGGRIDGALTAGLGYAHRVSEQLYLGAQVQLGGGAFFGNRNADAGFELRGLGAALGLSAFVPTGRQGRSWVKVGVPVLSVYRILDGRRRDDFTGGVPRTASLGWLYYFDGQRPYVRPEAAAGGGGLRGFSADLRFGAMYGTTGLAPRLNYTFGRWEAGVGTFVHPSGSGGYGRNPRYGIDYIPVTTALGYTLRRTEVARVQLLGEVMWPLNESNAAPNPVNPAVTLMVRYEHTLTERIAIGVEVGPNVGSSRLEDEWSTRGYLTGTLGVRYKLGG